jgi:hypothetical protein
MSTSLLTLAANAASKFNETTHQTLPLLIFVPTARCNSRCVSCDWWRADSASDLTLGEIRVLATELPALHTRLVLFSGGDWRDVLRGMNSWRYNLRVYESPIELRVLQRLVSYQRPETSGF